MLELTKLQLERFSLSPVLFNVQPIRVSKNLATGLNLTSGKKEFLSWAFTMLMTLPPSGNTFPRAWSTQTLLPANLY